MKEAFRPTQTTLTIEKQQKKQKLETTNFEDLSKFDFSFQKCNFYNPYHVQVLSAEYREIFFIGLTIKLSVLVAETRVLFNQILLLIRISCCSSFDRSIALKNSDKFFERMFFLDLFWFFRKIHR